MVKQEELYISTVTLPSASLQIALEYEFSPFFT